ncbi:MAG: hypothetical protein QF735_11070, partial [Phycisphaeraceae bacterium]|nr:hypothetical protein [Phycisphaeraceae bacterium]
MKELIMPALAVTKVLVVLSRPDEDGALMKAARRRGWPVLHDPTPGQLMHEVRLGWVRVVVVQIDRPVEEALQLIGELRQYWRPIYVVAAATRSNMDLEQVVRCAGANCFLAMSDVSRQLDDVVDRLLRADGELKIRACRAPIGVEHTAQAGVDWSG